MSDEPSHGPPAAAARAEDAEGRFRAIFEHSNDAIFLLDPEADAIRDVNPQACRMLGYGRAELLALRISDVHPAEMRAFVAFARAVLDTGSGWTNELSCLTRSGTTLPAEISASVIEMDGRACVIAMVRDISERKRAEAELQRYREDLERLVEERTAELRRSEQRQRALANCSATRRVRSRGRSPARSAASSWRTAGRSFWTRWASCRSTSRRSSSVCCKKESSSGWADRPSRSTSA